jgi:hypothetical protein
MNFFFLSFLTGWLLLLATLNPTNAQSLIAGIPNASVAHKGHFEMTHESQFNWWEGDLKWTSFNFWCYGVNDRTELTVTFNNLAVPGSGNLTAGVGFKHLIPLLPDHPKRELKLTVGTNALLSLQGRGAGFWSYSHLSGRLPVLRTRLTAGASYGTEQAFGFRYSKPDFAGRSELRPLRPLTFIGGIEQPLVGPVSLIADWFSGTHDLAALITALQVDTHKVTYIAGYKRANNRNSGVNALIIEVMYRF